MRKLSFCGMVVFWSCVAPVVFARDDLTFEGLGVLHLGMTVKEAEHAIASSLAPRDENFYENSSCWYTYRVEQINDGISYMVNGDKIRRIDVDRLDQKKQPIRTAEGIGIDSTHEQILEAYGTKVKVELHPYLGNDGNYLIIDNPEKLSRIIFETYKADGKSGIVDRFRVGFQPEVDYIEGCS